MRAGQPDRCDQPRGRLAVIHQHKDPGQPGYRDRGRDHRSCRNRGTGARCDSAVQDRISYFENMATAQNANAQPTTGGTALLERKPCKPAARPSKMQSVVRLTTRSRATPQTSHRWGGDDTLNGGAEKTPLFIVVSSPAIRSPIMVTGPIRWRIQRLTATEATRSVSKIKFSDVVYTISTEEWSPRVAQGSSGNINYFGQQYIKLGLVADELAPP